MNEEIKGKRKLYKFDVKDMATFRKNLRQINNVEGGRYKKQVAKKLDELPVKKINIL